MQQLCVDIVKEIQSLRRQGQGYKAIAKRLCLSPATVHKYSNDVSLSKKAKLKLIENQLSREYWFAQNFARKKEIKKPKLDEKFASVLGHLFFDGSVPHAYNGKYILNYTNSSFEAIENFAKNMNVLFCIKPQKIQKIKGKNIDWFEVCFMSKEAWNYVKRFSRSFSTSVNVGVPNQIKTASPIIQASFLKTFWDDEGCVAYNGRLSGFSKSKRMISDLVEMHRAFGVNCSKGKNSQSDLHIIRIKNDLENVARFSETIGFEYAKVTKGKNLGKFKKDVLQDIINAKVGP